MLSLLIFFAAQQTGPVMPVGVAPHVMKLSLSVQKSLHDGKFEAAAAALGDWPTGSLTYEVVGLPAMYSAAGKTAAAMVAEASQDRVKFAVGKEPRVVFTFVPMPADGPAEPVWKGGRVEMAVPITDRSGEPANERSIVWSLAKGMSYAAGLDHTTRRRSLMGPVAYTRSLSPATFSLPEQGQFTRLNEVYLALKAAVDAKSKLSPAAPRIEVEQGVVDMGSIIQGELKEFSLTIRNTGNAPASVEIETTCSCLIATSSLAVEPGKSVTIKPKFDSSDYQGEIEKHLYVLSNSLENPRETVVLKAVVAPEFRFLPPPGSRTLRSVGVGADLIEVEVPDTGAAKAELTFYGTQSTVEFVDVQLGNPLATASVIPFEGEVDDPLFGRIQRKGSKVVLGFPEAWPFGVSWLRIVGVTNSKQMPVAEMTLQVRKGIAVTPQSAYFGDAKVGETSERIAIIDHLSKPFKVTKVEAESNASISADAQKADATGKSYRLLIKVTPKAAGAITGSVRISTDSTRQPVIVVPIGGSAK